jgi:hypothetical protein
MVRRVMPSWRETVSFELRPDGSISNTSLRPLSTRGTSAAVSTLPTYYRTYRLVTVSAEGSGRSRSRTSHKMPENWAPWSSRAGAKGGASQNDARTELLCYLSCGLAIADFIKSSFLLTCSPALYPRPTTSHPAGLTSAGARFSEEGPADRVAYRRRGECTGCRRAPDR